MIVTTMMGGAANDEAPCVNGRACACSPNARGSALISGEFVGSELPVGDRRRLQQRFSEEVHWGLHRDKPHALRDVPKLSGAPCATRPCAQSVYGDALEVQ